MAIENVYERINNIHGNLYYRNDRRKFLSAYSNAGVSIDNANNSINIIKPFIKATYNNNVVSDFGSFSGEYKLNDNTISISY